MHPCSTALGICLHVESLFHPMKHAQSSGNLILIDCDISRLRLCCGKLKMDDGFVTFHPNGIHIDLGICKTVGLELVPLSVRIESQSTCVLAWKGLAELPTLRNVSNFLR